MPTVLPEGENLRKVLKWISGQVEDNPGTPVNNLINEAILRFDLNPKEAQFLINFYKKEKNEG